MTKVAIVTGGNKGIGFAIVKGLAKVFDGDVYLTARSAERGMAAVKLLAQENITVEFFPLDIDDPRSNEAIAAFMKEEYGGIDILVNNAGIAFKNDATESIYHQAKETIATNYFSVKNTCEHLFPLLRSGARVVNVSSSCGFLHRIPDESLRQKFADDYLKSEELDVLMIDFINRTQDGTHSQKGWPNSTYVVSKVGLSALTRIQQREINKDSTRSDIAINHIHPGYVGTDMSSHKGPLTIEEGAKSSLFAATLPPSTEIKGQYIWFDCSILDWVNGVTPAKWT